MQQVQQALASQLQQVLQRWAWCLPVLRQPLRFGAPPRAPQLRLWLHQWLALALALGGNSRPRLALALARRLRHRWRAVLALLAHPVRFSVPRVCLAQWSTLHSKLFLMPEQQTTFLF